MTDDDLKAAEAWMRRFQDMDLDLDSLVDPARAAGKISRRMRELQDLLPFERAPGRFTEVLEKFAAKDGGDD